MAKKEEEKPRIYGEEQVIEALKDFDPITYGDFVEVTHDDGKVKGTIISMFPGFYLLTEDAKTLMIRDIKRIELIERNLERSVDMIMRQHKMANKLSDLTAFTHGQVLMLDTPLVKLEQLEKQRVLGPDPGIR